jgi:eukaryotic-like serine/threonine-protein kinase
MTAVLEGKLAADYDDLGPVASGAQGEVRRVVDKSLLRTLAMKLLDPAHASEEAHRRRFVEEAQITAQLDHPNVPPVHRIGIDDGGQLYFTMKLLEGKTFEDVLKAGAHHGDWKELFRMLQVLVTVCNAVAFAHARGVLHRDLKPENVMVGEHGQVYVMDWGIARVVQRRSGSVPDSGPGVRVWRQASAEEGVIAGTPEYMSPEQAAGRNADVDVRTDVFALGAILYRILVGRPPYDGATPLVTLMRAAVGQYDPPMQAAPHPVPEVLCEIAVRAMQLDPALRYPTVDAFRDEVESFMRAPTHLPLRRFAAGEVIVREGDQADCAFILVRGRARVYKNVAGRSEVLRELGPGSAFGEASVFTAQTRTASVQALEPITAMVVTRGSLEQELERSSTLAPLVRQLATTFCDVDQQLTAYRSGAVALARATLLWVAMHGTEVAPKVKAVRWIPLRRHLCAAFACGGDEAMACVQAMAEAKLDVENDLLTVRLDHYGG